MSPQIEFTLAFYYTLVAQTNAARMTMIAGYTWVIYDWLISLDQEIEFVWRKPGNWPSKALFAFTRYYGIAFLTYDLIVVCGVWGTKFCHDYFFILGGGGFLLLFAVEAALQLRIYVLYNCSKTILIFNGVCFVLEASAMVTLYMLDTILYAPLPTPSGLTGCWSSALHVTYTRYLWWICLAFESWLSVLVMIKAWQSWREFGIRSPVLMILIRDSLIYYLLLAGCLLWMAMAWLVAPPGLLLLGVPLTHASATIGGSRLLLNLRTAYFGKDMDTVVGRNSTWRAQNPNFRTIGSKSMGTGGSTIDTYGGSTFGSVGERTKTFSALRDSRDDALRAAWEVDLRGGAVDDLEVSVGNGLEVHGMQDRSGMVRGEDALARSGRRRKTQEARARQSGSSDWREP